VAVASRLARMDAAALTAFVVRGLDDDPSLVWHLRSTPATELSVEIHVPENPDRRVRLDVSHEWIGLILVQEEHEIIDFASDDDSLGEVVGAQLQRGIDYLRGRCTETVKGTRAGTTVSRTIHFPDGATAKAWTPPWQRLRHRLTGRSRSVKTSSHP
jgi:hypothetical protein